MKKLLVLLCVMLFFFGITGIANAALIDKGGGLIYDDVKGLTWLQDANYARTSGYHPNGRMTWDEAVTWAYTLTYYDKRGTWCDWRLPTTVDGPFDHGYDGTTTAGWNIISSELGYMYYDNLGNRGVYDTSGVPIPGGGLTNTGPFTNVQGDYYWSETEYASRPIQAWVFNFGHGGQNIIGKANHSYAWAVHDGEVPPVDCKVKTINIQNLIKYVESLDLEGVLELSLISKLRNAIKSFEKKQYKAAINKLTDFIKEVEAQQDKQIPRKDASFLITKAQTIIDLILKS